MSERADDDVRGEQRRAARQLKQQQQQIQRGESSTAMATVAERRSLPSPEIMLGQPWSNWVDAAKLHGNDGAESEESFKEFGKNREAMRLCREDMSIFGQCPAQDDFYLVMCSHCSQVVKPQAFQAHYERRHSSASKPPAASAPSSAFSLSTLSRNRGSGTGLGSGVGSSGGGVLLGRPSSGGSGVSSSSSSSVSSNSRLLKPAKEKLPGVQRRAHSPPFRMLHTDKILSPAVKVEKMHLKVDSSAKLVPAPSTPSSSSSATVSSNCTTSSSSAFKPGPICSSIPKAPHLASGQIPNGKGHASLSSLDRKPENSGGAGSRRHLYKRLSEREFNPDIHCGVLDITARKPCTRSLTCKTHSLSQRRAVLGRRKRFDTLLAEHKSKARERELQQTTPPLRDPHPSAPRLPTHDPHLVANGPAAAVAADPSRLYPLGKPKPHNSGLPRLNSSISHGGGGTLGDPSLVHEVPHPVAAAPDGVVPHSSDEGENEEREDAMDKLDCHYSGYHPRPAAYCAFGSRMFAKSCYSFDRRWDRLRVTLVSMLDKHVNAQLWKKIPLALENSSSSSSSSSSAPGHRTSTNSHGSAPSTGFLGPPAAPPQPPYGQSYDGKSALSYGTTLSARASAQGAADHPAYGTAQARQVSSSPQMPSAHSSSSPSLAAGRALKSRSAGTTKTSSSSASFRPRDGAAGFSTPLTPGSTGGGGGSNGSGLHSTTTTSSNASFPSKKRKNSSLLSSSHHAPSTNNASSFKKNCSSGSTYHALLAPSTSSSSSSSSSSHSGVHSVGLSCGPSVRTNSLSLKAEPSGGTAGGSSGPSPRGPPSGSPAESIKRMSVVMNSSDSTLSLGPFVHHQSSSSSAAADQHHHGDGRLEAKKRKGSPASSSLNSGGGGGGGGGGSRGGGLGGGGGGGGPGPGRPKVAKSPAINNIHGKHGRSVPGAPGLPSNSVLHQPKARP